MDTYRQNMGIGWRDTSLYYDIKLLFSVLFLVGIGIVMIYSASSALALNKFGTDYYFLKKQAVSSIAGIIAMIICRHFPLKYLRLLTYPLLSIAFLFLIAIHITGFGLTAGGATRWLRIWRLTFQPSEFARLCLVIYLAFSMSKKHEYLKDFYIGFLPHVIVLAVFTALIISQPDFGTAVIFFAVTWIMMFIAGIPIKHLFLSLVILLPFAYVFLLGADYRVDRLLSFWDPWQHAADRGYQTIHSLMAFGSGGLWGMGIGQGYQKLFYLPEPHTDFVFSVIGEELGLLGVLFIIGLFILILWRGINIAIKAEDAFESLLAAGITTSIGIQVCVNMGVTLALLPTKGLTLPFLSYGGTSLLLNMASIGLLMNIEAKNQ